MESLPQQATNSGDTDTRSQLWRLDEGIPRHITDNAPFLLKEGPWSTRPRSPNGDECHWINVAFNASTIEHIPEGMLHIYTNTIPDPVPLTIGGVPTIFYTESTIPEYITGDTGLVLSYLPDPCRDLDCGDRTPSITEMRAICDRLESMMDVKGAIFWKGTLIVLLDVTGGRDYQESSLPGSVAGKDTTYWLDPDDYEDTKKTIADWRDRGIFYDEADLPQVYKHHPGNLREQESA